MADASKTIDLIFNGVDKTQAATQAALRNLESFAGGVKTATQPIADFTVGAVKLEAGLLAAGTAILAFSVKSAADFDTSFRQISTIINASDEDLGKFRDSILQYASTTGRPLAEITAALGSAIGSGVDWSKSLDLIATAEKLAVATRSDLDSTTKVLVSTLNSYGMQITDAGKISDLFFKIIDEGDISMGDLANSFAKVAPIAKISGVSLEEVGAAIAVLTSSGIKPAESIEYLRGAISNIISPSGQAKDLAAELGINFSAAGLKADGLAGLLQKVAVATGGGADKMKILFGDIGGFTAAATLAGPQAEKFAETIKTMGNVTGATDAAYAKMSTSLTESTKKISSAFTVLTVQIGTPLLDEFGGVANAIANIFAALGASVKGGALKDLVAYVETLVAGLAKSMGAVAKNLPEALGKADLSQFSGGLDVVVKSLGRLFDGIDITTVEGLTHAINATGAAFLGLSSFTAGFIESFKTLFDWLIRVGAGLEKVDPEIFKMAGNMGGIITQVNALAGGLANLMPALTALIDILVAKQAFGLASSLAGMVPVIGALVAGPASMAALGVAFTVAGYNLGKDLNPHIDAFVSKMSGTKTTLGGWIYDLVNGAEEAEKFGFSTGGAAAGVTKMTAALVESAPATSNAQSEFRRSEIAMQNAAAATEKFTGSQKDLNAYTLKVVPVLDAVTGAITGYEHQLVKSATGAVKLGDSTTKAGDSTKKTAEEMKKAEEATRKWSEEMAKMDHAEKIKMIEQQTTISVAQIQADAEKITAAFNSINTSITSTGDVLGKLYGMFGNQNLSFSELSKINDQIDKENALREKSITLQNKMIEATIKEIDARIKAFANGEALIKIDGAGLQPHLEAFMWEILKTIQVRVNADGLKLLLGT